MRKKSEAVNKENMTSTCSQKPHLEAIRHKRHRCGRIRKNESVDESEKSKAVPFISTPSPVKKHNTRSTTRNSAEKPMVKSTKRVSFLSPLASVSPAEHPDTEQRPIINLPTESSPEQILLASKMKRDIFSLEVHVNNQADFIQKLKVEKSVLETKLGKSERKRTKVKESLRKLRREKAECDEALTDADLMLSDQRDITRGLEEENAEMSQRLFMITAVKKKNLREFSKDVVKELIKHMIRDVFRSDPEFRNHLLHILEDIEIPYISTAQDWRKCKADLLEGFFSISKRAVPVHFKDAPGIRDALLNLLKNLELYWTVNKRAFFRENARLTCMHE